MKIENYPNTGILNNLINLPHTP